MERAAVSAEPPKLLEPDRNQIEQFVDAMFRHCGKKGYVSFRSFFDDEISSKPFRIEAVPVKAGFKYLCDVAEDHARRAANEPKRIVFCPPIAVFNNKDHAAERDLLAGLVLSVELDKNPQQAQRQLEAILGPPTAIVRSGGKWQTPNGELQNKLHSHWRLTRAAQGNDELAKLKRLRRLAMRLVDSDASNVPIVHPIRWPGSWHRKQEPRLCQIETLKPDREIDLDAALAALEAALPDKDGNCFDSDAGQYSYEGERPDWAKLTANIVAGRDLHQSTLRLAASYVSSGMTATAALRMLQALMLATPLPHDERWKARFNDLGRLVDDGRAKYGNNQQNAEAAAAQTQSAVPLFDPWERFIAPEFPLRILPAAVREYVVSQSAVIGCDRSALAMAALTAISGALDHRFAVKMMRNGNWWEHPRLWTLLVGDPSRKKTPIINDVTRPLERHQNDLRRDYETRSRDYETAKKDGEKIEKPEPPVRYVVWDTTTEKLGEILSRSEHGLLVKRDEFSGWIGGMEKYSSASRGAGADRGFWLQAYDGGPHAVDRIGRGETYIGNLSVSLIGGIQPARLAELHGLTSDGLLQRFLPVMMLFAAASSDDPRVPEL
jgi:hypothetical protein